MKSLIVGMGIGQLYRDIYQQLGHDIVTVDQDVGKSADFQDIDSALALHGAFDTVHICTPNFTHAGLAQKAGKARCRIVFVEKPGVANKHVWITLIHTYKNTRFMMVKNNMWRDLSEIENLVDQSRKIKLKWINKNRIPSPGSWFTTKELAYGGVSRDLMPHLLSLYLALNPGWETSWQTGHNSQRIHSLDTIKDTEYGTVNPIGTYDVDDVCKIKFSHAGCQWKLEANWADGQADDRAIEIELKDGVKHRFELGLCPESAYNAMIQDAIANVDNDQWWTDQLTLDYWIHERLELF